MRNCQKNSLVIELSRYSRDVGNQALLVNNYNIYQGHPHFNLMFVMNLRPAKLVIYVRKNVSGFTDRARTQTECKIWD